MVQCCGAHCKNRSDVQGWRKRIGNGFVQRKVTFHCLPKDGELLKKWCTRLGIDETHISLANARVCSDHFSGDCFIVKGLKNYLKPYVLPDSSKQHTASTTNSTSISKIDSANKVDSSANNGNLNAVDKGTTVSPFDFPDGTLAQPRKLTMDQATDVSYVLKYNSPEKERLRKRIAYLQKEHSKNLKRANCRIRFQTEKYAKLMATIDESVKQRLFSIEKTEKVDT